jgi:hypothetical protein
MRIMKKIVLFFLLLSGISKAQVLDQVNSGSATNYVVLDNINVFKQTFKAGLTGLLTRIDVDMETSACNSTFSMQFYCAIYDSTGTNLLTSEMTSVPMPYSRAMNSIIFTTPASIDDYNTYVFELYTFNQACDTGGSPTSSTANIFHDLINTNYPNGEAFSNGSQLASDFYFHTYVDTSNCANPIVVNASTVAFPTCGQNNGSITCNPTGGAGGYTFSWTNAETTQTISNLPPGIYTVTVSDGAFCSTSSGLSISNVGTPVTVNDTSVNATCNGGCDGYADVTVLTGSPPYNYSWNVGGSTPNLNGLCAGMYIYTVSDINNCIVSDTLYVGQPNEIIGSFIVTNESCQFGDGYIDLNPIGDFPPFSYSWAHGPVTQDVNNLTAGNYSVTIIDNNGCTGLLNETVMYEPGAVIDTLQLDIQNNLCNQVNGHISNLGTAVTTSNAPINYTLNSQSISAAGEFNLVGGLYELIAIDALGCSDTATITILDLGTPFSVFQGSSFTPPCPDVCTGTITAIVSGGSAPFTYNWDNGMTGITIMNLCHGDYNVLVTDAVGCTASGLMSLIPPQPFDVSFNTNNPTCGASDGNITATVNSGGTAPFTYSWSNGDDAIMADSLEAGYYSVNITDINNCSAYRVVSINSASGPTITDNITHPNCHGSSDGSIDLTITGGTAPISILWSTGHTSEDISSLSSGYYDVAISDASGCMINKTYQLNNPSLIEIAPVITPAGCTQSDGEIDLVASGGTGNLSYLWDANTGNSTAASIVNFPAGIYSVTITDDNGCSEFFEIGLSNDNSPTITVDQVIYPNCQTGGGAMFITANGGTTPYSYLWSNGSIAADLQNVAEGNYSLTITDASNCIANVSFTLPGINIFAQEICMITVDTLTNMNKVLWEKTPGIGIEEFRVYRETSVPNNYLLIGIIPFDSLSVFQDTVASSDIHAWKYKLATVDSCGNESNFIASHKSIHLITEVNANWDVYLEWDDYIGFPYTEFYINRYHISTGWEVIDTVSKFVHSYIDMNAPNGNVGYSITVPAPSDCEPTRVGVNTSRSNIRNQPVAAPNGLNENENIFSLNIYPNPAMNEVNISLVNFDGAEVDLKLFNSIGELILVQKMNANQLRLDTKDLPSGVYTVSVSSENNNVFKKLMIVK